MKYIRKNINDFKQFVNEDKYYDQDDDEYYELININISDIILSKRSLLGVFDNFLNNKKSQSYNKPLIVWKNDDGKFFLVDGYHRVFDYLMSDKLLQNVIVTGEGYTDYYAEPSGDNIFYANQKYKYNGLENIIDTNMIDSLI